jgi:general secretion pathway protein A
MLDRPLLKVTSAQTSPDTASTPRGADERNTQKAELQPSGGLRRELFYERYGILENPFGVTPDPRYLYESRTHAEARSSLIVGLEYGIGFQTLIAPPGMGKTTILFDVLERFHDVARTAFLFQIHGNSHDFLRHLISDLGGETHDSDLPGMQDTINQLLIADRRRTIVIIDEAQNLDTSVLETVRLLSNFETSTEKLLQIILAGQPQLAARLATPEAAQLHQRISIRTTLIPFDLEDTKNYIAHRLRVAGYQGPPMFTPAGVKLIWERSGGVPREINTLCFNALLLATAVKQKQVDSDILHEVVADLELNLNPNPNPNPNLNPSRFKANQPSTGTWEMQTAPGPEQGKRETEPRPSNLVEISKVVVPSANGQTEAAPVGSTASDGVGLEPIAAEVVQTGAGEKSKPASAQEAPAAVEHTVVDAAQLEPAAASGDCKTSAVASEKKAVNLSSCETEAAGTSAKTPDALSEAPEISNANNPATDPGQPRLTRKRISALTILAIVGSLAVIIGSLGKEKPEQPSVARTAALRTTSTAGIAREIQQPTDPGTAADNAPAPAHNADEVPSAADAATSGFGNAKSSVLAAGINSHAGPGTNMVLAQLIHTVKPIYPPAAREAQIQGSVVLQVLVGTDGGVRSARFLSGSPVLAPAALDAVQGWRYRPSYLNGQAVESEMLVTVKFSIR